MSSLDVDDSRTNDSAVPDPHTVRFKVSGEAHDIHLSTLNRWPECMWYGAARTSMTLGQVDKDGTPLVTIARNSRRFDTLRHYMETKELIIPDNATDRQLLLVDAGYYNFQCVVALLITRGARFDIDTTVNQMLVNTVVPVPVRKTGNTNSGTTDGKAPVEIAAEEKPAADVEQHVATNDSRFCGPSDASVAKYAREMMLYGTDVNVTNKINTTESPPDPLALNGWSFCIPRDDILESQPIPLEQADATIRAAEYALRVRFADESYMDKPEAKLPQLMKPYFSVSVEPPTEFVDGKSEANTDSIDVRTGSSNTSCSYALLQYSNNRVTMDMSQTPTVSSSSSAGAGLSTPSISVESNKLPVKLEDTARIAFVN